MIRHLVGDCRETLPTLEPGSVQACVTSPPYYSLRDYGTPPLVWGGDEGHAHDFEDVHRLQRSGVNHDGGAGYREREDRRFLIHSGLCACGAWLGSLGLEPTPGAYIDHLVDCFRHVRRVLRDDGVLWLNLGSSYAGSRKGPSGKNGIGGQSERQGWTGSRHESACGTGGKERSDSRGPGSFCSDLCGECRAAIVRQFPHSAGTSPPHLASASLPSQTDRGSERSDFAGAPPDASLRVVQESNSAESFRLPPDACSHCANCGACLSVLHSVSRDARLCVRRTVALSETDSIVAAIQDLCSRICDTGAIDDSFLRRITGMVSDLAQRKSTIAPHHYQPKDEMLIPFRVALAMQADGWIVRSVIPWLKRCAMPESVIDRPSTSVEYVFLLSKSARYFWNADAVRAPHARIWDASKPNGTTLAGGSDYTIQQGQPTGHVRQNAPIEPNPNGRNRRNGDWFFESWQGLMLDEQDEPLALVVNPRPFSGAHFATFPPRLVEPMVKASTRPGDTILDPFSGAGTVGLVANRLGRDAVLAELKPEYAEMSAGRIDGDAPMFTELSA